MGDAFARKTVLRVEFVCTETDRSAEHDFDYPRDVEEVPNDGYYAPEKRVRLGNCPACGGNHVIDL